MNDKRKVNKPFFIIILVVFLALTVSGQSKATVHVAAETMVSGDQVTLGDVAEISGEAEKTKKLKSISLGYAPNVGAVREIERKRVELAIAASGFSSDEIQLNFPSRILLKRVGQKLDSELLRKVVENAVLPAFQANGATAKIVRIDLPENIEIPAGRVSIKAITNAVNNLTVPFSVALEIQVNERTLKRINAIVQIEVFAPVFIVANNVAAGANLSETDVQLEIRQLEKPLTSYLNEAQQLRGAVLLKNLTAGSVVTRDAVVAGVVVKTGDLIRITGESGKFKIMIEGEARASGRIGDRIAVKNLQSGANLQAIVVDAGLVQIRF